MAVYNVPGLVEAGTRLPGHFQGQGAVVPAVIDLSKINVGTGIDTNDIVHAIYVPAKTVVHGVHVEVKAGQSPDELFATFDDIDVGDYTLADVAVDIDGWHDALDATGALNVYNGVGSGTPTLTEGTPNVFPVGYPVGKFYATAHWISVTFKTAAQTDIKAGIIRLSASMMPHHVMPLGD